jgi:hypothetical protein
MTRFKLLSAFAILSILIATRVDAHGIDGREAAVRPWNIACMPDQGPGVCGESTWFRGTIGDHAGKNTALSPELNAPLKNGGDEPHIDWPANMILG